jgi:hypothetical protein
MRQASDVGDEFKGENMDGKNKVHKLPGGLVHIELARPLPAKVSAKLVLVIGSRRGSAVHVDKRDRIVAVDCDPRDWEDLIREHVKRRARADRLIEEFRAAITD